MKRLWKFVSLFFTLLIWSGCENKEEVRTSSGYGAYLSLIGSDAVRATEGKKKVVLDPQYVSKEEVASIKERGTEVYAYLNLGSLETFRPYYEDYEELILGPYRNWEEEYWIDVKNRNWQEFIGITLANEIVEKGMDGFWVDNVDVYGQFPNPEIYAGVETILKELMTHKKAVIINGGNEFVQMYLEENQQVDEILTGVNQETIFSSINFEEETFGKQKREERLYYLEYITEMAEQGKDVFLLEYTTNQRLSRKIKEYAEERGWEYYISNSIELDGD